MTEKEGASGVSTGVNVEIKLFPFRTSLLKVFLCVNDAPPMRLPLPSTFIPLSPGLHTLRCYVSYPYQRHLGDSTIQVDVPSDGVYTFLWKSPKLVFASGKWEDVTSI